MIKTCVNCNLIKATSDFPKRSKQNDETHSYCKECAKSYNTKWKFKKYNEDIEFKNKTVKSAREYRKVNNEQVRLNNKLRNREYRKTKDGIVYYLNNSCRQNAKNNNVTFNLTREFIRLLIDAQNWKCCRTGIEFTLNVGSGRMPFGPSIDRKNPSYGYEIWNIQIVCMMYNLCKNKWSDDEVIIFAKALMEKVK